MACQSETYDNYIGSGGFGKVYGIKGTDLLKKVMDLRCNENLREICFLSTYKHIPFITQIEKCEIDVANNNINMYMKSAGISLRDLSKILNIEDRIKLVPTLMVQFARILIWLKQEKILHCDIKPANICIDNDNNIKLIDWGFVQKYSSRKQYKIGTQVFYDPYTYFDEIDHFSEIFAFGMTLCYFILSGFDYDEWEDFCHSFDDKDTSTLKTNPDKIQELNKEALYILEIEKTHKKFNDILENSHYYDLLIQMLHIDPKERINMYELYNDCSSLLKQNYPLTQCYTHIYEDCTIDTTLDKSNNYKSETNNKILGMVIEWMISLKFNLKIRYSLSNAIQLMFRYINTGCSNVSDIPCIGTVCLLISNIMNNETIIDISKCTKICELKNENDIYTLLVKVLNTLQFEVYPEIENFEYHQKDEDLWRSVFLKSYDNSHMFIMKSFSIRTFQELYIEKKQLREIKRINECYSK
jgi:serine/threonine protein kinase